MTSPDITPHSEIMTLDLLSDEPKLLLLLICVFIYVFIMVNIWPWTYLGLSCLSLFPWTAANLLMSLFPVVFMIAVLAA